MTLLRVASIIVLAGAILACEPELAPIDYGDPTQSGVIASPIHLTLLSPDPSTPVLSPSVYLHIVSSGQDRPDRVEVSLDAGPYIEATLTEDQSYRYRAPLLPGVNVVDLRASSAEGTQHIQRFELRYEGESPGIRILTPVAYSPVGSEGVHVEGLARASEGRGVVEVLVCGGGDSWSVAEHVDGFFSLSHVVVTDPQGQLKARVIDSAGQSSQMFIELLMDEIPPTLTLSSPGSGAVVEEAFVWVEGIALDDAGVSHVEVNVGDAGWVFASGVAPFEAFVTLDPGWNEIDVRVVDLAGNQTQMQRWVYRERHVSLVAHPAYAAGETLTLSIGKAALEALLPADAADDIVLMYLDVMVLLEEALKTVIGSDVRNDKNVSNYFRT